MKFKHVVLSVMLSIGALSMVAGCGSSGGGDGGSTVDIVGSWNTFWESTIDDSTSTGTINFTSDGTYTSDDTSDTGDHQIGGGTWSVSGSALTLKLTWRQFDGEAVEHFDSGPGLTYSADVGSNGSYKLTSGTNNTFVTISR